MSQYQPVSNKVLIKFHPPKRDKIVIPDTVNEPMPEIEVLDIGHLVNVPTIWLYIGDFVILRPDPNIIPLDQDEKIGLIDASVIIAIDKGKDLELES